MKTQEQFETDGCSSLDRRYKNRQEQSRWATFDLLALMLKENCKSECYVANQAQHPTSVTEKKTREVRCTWFQKCKCGGNRICNSASLKKHAVFIMHLSESVICNWMNMISYFASYSSLLVDMEVPPSQRRYVRKRAEVTWHSNWGGNRPWNFRRWTDDIPPQLWP